VSDPKFKGAVGLGKIAYNLIFGVQEVCASERYARPRVFCRCVGISLHSWVIESIDRASGPGRCKTTMTSDGVLRRMIQSLKLPMRISV
jgi:hypothetical protein